jgi:hypothetical protein
MYVLSVHWDLLRLWAILSLTGKLYIFCLLVGVVYAIYFSFSANGWFS